MIPPKIHKKMGLPLLALCLALLSACSAGAGSQIAAFFSTPASPSLSEQPSPNLSPSPLSPPAEPTALPPGTEPSLPPEPAVEPYDYSLPAPESEEVDVSWFEDAVFIGDSRTDGLRIYGGVSEPDFICYKGLMCMDFDQRACITSGDQKITPKAALEKKSYGKIFVMLGLNELDFAVETFAADYADLIDQIRAVQPDAVLYCQSLVPVNDQKAREKNQPHYVTNEKIAAFNAEVVRITQEKQVILVDVAAGLTDENGILPYDATHDGVHFNRALYQEWFAYLQKHTVDPQRLEAVT